MTKRGRKAKPGARYPCGKRTEGQRLDDIIGVAVESRLRAHGLKADRVYFAHKNDDGMTGRQIAETNILGSPLNKLLHWRMITADQSIAGHNFAEVLRDYLSTGKLQNPTQSKAGFIPGAPDNGEGPPVKGETRAKAYMEALAEIDRTDPFSAPTATSVVWDVCINEIDRMHKHEIGALRVGLNAIHRILYGRKAA